jgi:hypothetical protein
MSGEEHGPTRRHLTDVGVIGELLREVGARELERAPRQHGDRTLDCLSLPALDDVTTRGFTEPQLLHVPMCPFCQRLLAMAWRLECPGIRLLLVHLRPPSPVGEAMLEHIETDGCRRCQRLVGSRLLRALPARSQRATRGDADRVDVAAAFGFLPPVVGSFAAPAWPITAEPTSDGPGPPTDDESPWPFRLRTSTPGGIAATLRQTDRDGLVLHLRSNDPADDGRTVDVEVVGDGGRLEASVVLRSSRGRCEGSHGFGRLHDLRPLLGGSCAIVVWPRDEPSPWSRPER